MSPAIHVQSFKMCLLRLLQLVLYEGGGGGGGGPGIPRNLEIEYGYCHRY